MVLPNAILTGDDGAGGASFATAFMLSLWQRLICSTREPESLRGDDAKFFASFPLLRTARFSARVRCALDHSTKASTAARSALSFFRSVFTSFDVLLGLPPDDEAPPSICELSRDMFRFCGTCTLRLAA